MATPIAHTGAAAGAKVMAMTMLDLLLRPELVEQAQAYFRDVQTKDMQYIPFETADDQPATDLNEELMAEYRPEMEQYFYDPGQYDSYLDQLGITYPTLERTAQ
ncbi:MAG: amidohydrolase, partial [Geminicoccaceae bacterium]